MPNIFDGLEKTDVDSLRYQLASLEEITVRNVMGEMGQKAHRGAVKVFNGLRKNQSNGKKIVITKICKHNDSRYGK